jgi:hypothetical protein
VMWSSGPPPLGHAQTRSPTPRCEAWWRPTGWACAAGGILLDCPPSDRESRPVGDRIEVQAQMSGGPTEAECPRGNLLRPRRRDFLRSGPDSATAQIDRLEIDRFMTASSVFRLVHTCLTAGAVAGLLPVRAVQAGVCPVVLRALATSAKGTSEAGEYSERSIATSKRGLDSQITKTECSAQTGMEVPRPRV